MVMRYVWFSGKFAAPSFAYCHCIEFNSFTYHTICAIKVLKFAKISSQYHLMYVS